MENQKQAKGCSFKELHFRMKWINFRNIYQAVDLSSASSGEGAAAGATPPVVGLQKKNF